MDTKALGQTLMLLGGAAVLLGALVWSGALSWFGRLPGDIRWESGSTRVYAPLASGLLLSIVLSVIMFLVRKIGGR